ncbi:MAG TPA: calcium-binding protein [Noviherbaspirillum sp.]
MADDVLPLANRSKRACMMLVVNASDKDTGRVFSFQLRHHYRIETIAFADGTTWNSATVATGFRGEAVFIQGGRLPDRGVFKCLPHYC